MPSPSRPQAARIATGLFLFAGAVLILANLLILAEVPYMPVRYTLALLGRATMLAALGWIVLRGQVGRWASVTLGAAGTVLVALVLTEIGVLEAALGNSLNLSPQQVRRAVGGTLSDAFIVMIMLACAAMLARARRTAQRAEAGERRQRLIFNQSNDAIVVIDVQAGSILEANPAASRMLEYPQDELVGMDLSIIHPSDLPELRAFARTVTRDGGGRTDELACYTKSGRSVPAEIAASPLELNGRQCLLAVVRSITQRREAELELRESLERYRLLVEATRVIPWELDLGTWRFTYVAPQAVEVFGYPLNDWYAADFWSDHLHPDDRQATLRACREASDRQQDHELEYRMFTADGESRWVRDIVSFVHEENGSAMLRGVMIDQSEQKQAALALRESESLRRSIMDNSPDYVAMVDLDGRILFINQTGPHLAEKDVLGFTIYDHAPAEFHGAIRDCFARVAQSGESDHFETEYHAPDGDVAVFAFRVGPFFKDGKVTSLILNSTNITEQKQAEANLRESERRLELAVTGGDLGLWDWNISTGELFFSERWAQNLEYSLDEIEPQLSVWASLVHPDDRQRAMDAMVSHLKGIAPVYVSEHRMKTKSGKWKWVLGRGKVVERDVQGGRATRASGTQIDIDDRKRTTEALQHSEALRRSITDSSPDHVMLLDADGTIQFINRTIPEYTVEQVLGTKVYEYIPASFHEEVSACLSRVCQTAEPDSYVVDHYSPDGAVTIFESYVGPVVEAGEVIAVVVHSRDITARRIEEQRRLQLEQRVLGAQKLESLGVMAGGVAHDFNNLLTGILGQAGLALDDLAEDSPAQDSIESIEKAARRAAELCRQLLVFAGRESFSTQAIELNSVVSEMTELLEAVVSKNAELQLELGEEFPRIDGDSAQIGRVVVNLITNASDAVADQSGSARNITIRTGSVTIGELEAADAIPDTPLVPGQYAYLEVTDSGCGMDDETRKKIFDPFFSTKFTGRGLGLAAVLGIVRGHRGGIQISSRPQAGTTIRVLFPLSTKQQVPVPENRKPRTAPPTPKEAATILVVDDEEIVRAAAGRALERAGYRVLVAGDGREGVDVFKGHAEEVSAVLLDLTMPHRDGRETLAAIRRIRADVPVILSSGYEQQAGSADDHDLTQFLQKPYRPHVLIQKLDGILNG